MNLPKLLSLLLVGSIALSPVFLSSCDDDDDDAEPEEETAFEFDVTGDTEESIEGTETRFDYQDEAGYEDFDSEEDAYVNVSTGTQDQEEPNVAFSLAEQGTDQITEGEFSIPEGPMDANEVFAEEGAVASATVGEDYPFNDGGGYIEVTSSSEDEISGEFHDVVLRNQDDEQVTVNGTFEVTN